MHWQGPFKSRRLIPLVCVVGILLMPALSLGVSVATAGTSPNYGAFATAAGGIGRYGDDAARLVGHRGVPLQNAPYQPIRNAPESIARRDYTGHALDQIQNRGLTPSVVENTIGQGTTFPTRAGTTGFYDPVNNVRVITDSASGRVITVIPGAP